MAASALAKKQTLKRNTFEEIQINYFEVSKSNPLKYCQI